MGLTACFLGRKDDKSQVIPQKMHCKFQIIMKCAFSLYCSVGFAVAFSIPSDVEAGPIECANTEAWFAETVEQNPTVGWDTPVGGTVVPLPEAEPEGSGPIEVEVDLDDLNVDKRIYFSVSNLSLGQAVRIERFLVDNAIGEINGNAILLDSRVVVDGYLPTTGNEVSYSEVLDYVEVNLEAVTARDGMIETFLPARSALERLAGDYVIRFSSPSGSFAPVTETVFLPAETTEQDFWGTVVDEDGEPVPFAVVGLAQSLDSYLHLMSATRADENGYFALPAPHEGEYQLVAAAPGYIVSISRDEEVRLQEGQSLERDITLIPGTRSLSGSIRHLTSGESIPGLPVTLVTLGTDGLPDNRFFSHTWTDGSGEFTVSLTPDRWGVFFKPTDLSGRGFLTNLEAPVAIADLGAGDLDDFVVSLTPTTCLIVGTMRNETGVIIEDVEIFAFNRADGTVAAANSWEDGWFTIAVTPGEWDILPFSYTLREAGFPAARKTWACLTADNQSIEVNLTAEALNGWMYGQVTDPSGQPVANLRIQAIRTATDYVDPPFQYTYGDGWFDLALSPGEWFIFPDAESAARRQLLFSNLPRFTVSEDADFLDNFFDASLQLEASTGVIEFSLLDDQGQPVPNVRMHAGMTNGVGKTYDAFGITDENGLARIAVVPGDWHIHLSTRDLAAAGMVEMPYLDVTVTQATTVFDSVATPFGGGNLAVNDVIPTAAKGMRLSGVGESGRSYFIEGSFDLVSWYKLGRVSAIGGTFTVTTPTPPKKENQVGFIRIAK